MTYVSSDEWPKDSIFYKNFEKELKTFLIYFKGVPTFSQSRPKNQQYNILSANALTSPNKIACVEYSFLDEV